MGRKRDREDREKEENQTHASVEKNRRLRLWVLIHSFDRAIYLLELVHGGC